MRSATVRAWLLLLAAALAVSTGSGQPPVPKMPEPRPLVLPKPNPWNVGPPGSAVPERPKEGAKEPPEKKEPPKLVDPTDPRVKEPPFRIKIQPVPPELVGGPQILDTAFPDLKPPEYKEINDPVVGRRTVVVEATVVPLPPFPVVKADAPLLHKVQYEQMREGFEYIYRVRALDAIQGRGSDYQYNVAVTAEIYRLAAELEETPAKRVPWYEARVRAFKEIERSFRNRVNIGTQPPQGLNLIRMERLKVEADLLKLKEEVEKAKK